MSILYQVSGNHGENGPTATPLARVPQGLELVPAQISRLKGKTVLATNLRRLHALLIFLSLPTLALLLLEHLVLLELQILPALLALPLALLLAILSILPLAPSTLLILLVAAQPPSRASESKSLNQLARSTPVQVIV